MEPSDLAHGNWSRFSNCINGYLKRSDLTVREQRVYWTCYEAANGFNRQTNTGYIGTIITLAKLAKETGLSESHACEARSSLVQKGLLSREGKYTILNFPISGSSDRFPESGSKVPSSGKKNFPNTGSKKSNSPHQKAKNKTPKDNSKDINPKKVGKSSINENSCGASQHSIEAIAEVIKQSFGKGFDDDKKLKSYVWRHREQLEHLQLYKEQDICMAIIRSERHAEKKKYAMTPRHVAGAIESVEGRHPKNAETKKRLTTLLSFFPS